MPGAESRHNLIYWRYGDYAGVGPGAHGRLVAGGQRTATAAIKLPERWHRYRVKKGTALRKVAVHDGDAAREHLLMNLRLREGIDLAAYRTALGRAARCGKRSPNLREQGFLTLNGDILTATPARSPAPQPRDRGTC